MVSNSTSAPSAPASSMQASSVPRHTVQQRSATNTDLQRRVQLFLAQTQRSELRELDIQAEDGIVVLRGQVRSFHARQVAVHSSQRVAGVVRVVDELTVA